MPILRESPQRPHAAPNSVTGTVTSERAVRILAKSMFKELREQGYGEREIVQLANELLSQLVAEKRR